MSIPTPIGLPTLAIAVFAVLVPAQDHGAGPKKEPSQTPERQTVVIVGASVSAGFADPTSQGKDGTVNRTFKLDVAFKKAWPREVARIYNYADLMMFMQPVERGRKQLASAIKRKPDLIVGVDFLTWFGYGSTLGRVADGEVDPKRMALQEQGLALLQAITCPIVLGDYPDMHGASSHMLPQSMIPNVPTLAALNKALRDWAAKRENVLVFPLARFAKEAVSKEQTYPFGDKSIVFPKNFLLQSDRLHATRLGTMVIVLRVTQALPALLGAKHPLVAKEVSLQSLVEAAGLRDELPGDR